jgi:hypothetical protein
MVHSSTSAAFAENKRRAHQRARCTETLAVDCSRHRKPTSGVLEEGYPYILGILLRHYTTAEDTGQASGASFTLKSVQLAETRGRGAEDSFARSKA